MLEEKVEALTKEIVALRQAIEKNGVPAEAKASAAKTKTTEEDAPKATRGKAKPKAVEPEHDEDEVGSTFRKAAKIDKPKCKKYLTKVGCEDLAELLTKPELYDAAFEFAEAIVDADDDDDDDDDV